MSKTDANVVAESNAAKSIKSVSQLSPLEIHANPDLNFSRYSAQSIATHPKTKDLAYRMSVEGNRDPVDVCETPGVGLDLISGFRRHSAATLIVRGFNYTYPESHEQAGETVLIHNPDFKLKVIKVPRPNARERLKRNVGENADREPLTAMDYYHICYRATEVEGMSVKDTAALIGCDPSYVSQYIKLGALPHEIQQSLASGLIKPSIRVLMKLTELEDGSEKQKEFFQDLLNGEKVTLDMVKLAIHEQNLKNAPDDDGEDKGEDNDGEGGESKGGKSRKGANGAGALKDCSLNVKQIRTMCEGQVGPAEFAPVAGFCNWFVTKFMKGHGGTPESPSKFTNAFDRLAFGVMRAVIDYGQRNNIDLNSVDLNDKKAFDNLCKLVRDDAAYAYKPSKDD